MKCSSWQKEIDTHRHWQAELVAKGKVSECEIVKNNQAGASKKESIRSRRENNTRQINNHKKEQV